MNQKEWINLSIYNLLGQLILEKTIEAQTHQVETLDISQWPSDPYFIKFSGTTGQMSKTFIKQ